MVEPPKIQMYQFIIAPDGSWLTLTAHTDYALGYGLIREAGFELLRVHGEYFGGLVPKDTPVDPEITLTKKGNLRIGGVKFRARDYADLVD